MLTETLHTAFFDFGTKKTGTKNAGVQAAGETALFGRKLCEEFAPRNEGIRLSEERGANQSARAPAKLHFPAGSCVKNLLPGTKT